MRGTYKDSQQGRPRRQFSFIGVILQSGTMRVICEIKNPDEIGRVMMWNVLYLSGLDIGLGGSAHDEIWL
jgi:hypothetical protein